MGCVCVCVCVCVCRGSRCITLMDWDLRKDHSVTKMVGCCSSWRHTGLIADTHTHTHTHTHTDTHTHTYTHRHTHSHTHTHTHTQVHMHRDINSLPGKHYGNKCGINGILRCEQFLYFNSQPKSDSSLQIV